MREDRRSAACPRDARLTRGGHGHASSMVQGEPSRAVLCCSGGEPGGGLSGSLSLNLGGSQHVSGRSGTEFGCDARLSVCLDDLISLCFC